MHCAMKCSNLLVSCLQYWTEESIFRSERVKPHGLKFRLLFCFQRKHLNLTLGAYESRFMYIRTVMLICLKKICCFWTT